MSFLSSFLNLLEGHPAPQHQQLNMQGKATTYAPLTQAQQQTDNAVIAADGARMYQTAHPGRTYTPGQNGETYTGGLNRGVYQRALNVPQAPNQDLYSAWLAAARPAPQPVQFANRFKGDFQASVPYNTFSPQNFNSVSPQGAYNPGLIPIQQQGSAARIVNNSSYFE